jgi:hypothetical protein
MLRHRSQDGSDAQTTGDGKMTNRGWWFLIMGIVLLVAAVTAVSPFLRQKRPAKAAPDVMTLRDVEPLDHNAALALMTDAERRLAADPAAALDLCEKAEAKADLMDKEFVARMHLLRARAHDKRGEYGPVITAMEMYAGVMPYEIEQDVWGMLVRAYEAEDVVTGKMLRAILDDYKAGKEDLLRARTRIRRLVDPNLDPPD